MDKFDETESYAGFEINRTDKAADSVKQLSEYIYQEVNQLHIRPEPIKVLDMTRKWLPWAKENNSELYNWLEYKKIYSLYRLSRYEDALTQIDVVINERNCELYEQIQFYALKALILRLSSGGREAVEFLNHVLKSVGKDQWKDLEIIYTDAVAELYRVWAWCLLESSWKNTDKALELMERSDQLYRIYPERFTEGSAGEICYTYSIVLFHMKHLHEAKKKAEQALSLFITSYGRTSVELCNTYNQLGSIYCSLKEYEKAANAYHSSYSLRKTAYGEENLLTSISYGNYIRIVSQMDQSFCQQHRKQFLDIILQRQNGIDPKKIWTGRAWRELALYEQRWPEQINMQEVDTHFNNSEICFLESQNKTEYAISLKAHGNYLEERGHCKEALSYYLKAQPLIMSSFAPTHPICNDIQQSVLRVQSKI